jgi:mycothiol S-conjugate amidase
VAKLFYVTWPAERVRAMHQMFLELGLESPYDEAFLARLDNYVDDTTHKVDISGFGHIRELSLKAHATQIDPNSKWWFGLPSSVQAELYPFEHYRLADSRLSGFVESGNDLFEGL